MPVIFARRKSVVVGAVAVAAAAVALAPQVSANATGTVDPSGKAPARQSFWHKKFIDEFTGTSINRAHWAVYNNHNWSNPRGARLAQNAIVHNGMLTLRTTKVHGHWTAAGICSAKITTGTYGKYLIRARFHRGYGVRAVGLLWPQGNTWPPEVDFMEFGGTDPSHSDLMLTNHYNSNNRMQHAFVHGNYGKWHTFGLVWRPDRLRFTLDGKTTAVMRGHVPTKRMWLGLQTALSATHRPNATTPRRVDLDVDWVAYYTAPARAGWTH
jgi:beta-glucanase (GH16 family)